MARTRRKANATGAPSSRVSHEDEPKWLVATVASLILFVALWADHGSLAEEFGPNVRGMASRGEPFRVERAWPGLIQR